MNEGESFTRLLFYGMSLRYRPEREAWFMLFGALLDQRELFHLLSTFFLQQ